MLFSFELFSVFEVIGLFTLLLFIFVLLISVSRSRSGSCFDSLCHSTSVTMLGEIRR